MNASFFWINILLSYWESAWFYLYHWQFWFVSQWNQILKRETALATAAVYDSMFAEEDGTIPATFQVIIVQCFL